ncbi:hypothetical protein [Microvirga sp. VF16]|uniref:hypothetical protein n=1 Tax=Microvirga sp. VF16 TaxID=2807101 RepID=UPI00193E3F0F|nr:hypothetical protein [Microvirga sp. VF16]QRM34195.1 hypothetical protein JO965_33605 [Microvirga sp. VF16]
MAQSTSATSVNCGICLQADTITIGRFAGGKLKEDRVELDRLGLFPQLGCLPTGS